MDKEWKEFLDGEFKKGYMINLRVFITKERAEKTIYPSSVDTFRAFTYCPYKDLKVVILGQDPYHSRNTADGLAFSTKQEDCPPSLGYIFQEVWEDYWGGQRLNYEVKSQVFKSNSLIEWAKQGVLLLNTILTVEEKTANSHKGKGWEQFTTNCIYWLQNYPDPLIFMLWGVNAKSYKRLINQNKHFVLEAAHPAAEIHKPGDGSFLGCKHFTQANKLILKRSIGKKEQYKRLPINWRTVI